jgi:hypothetical protein
LFIEPQKHQKSHEPQPEKEWVRDHMRWRFAFVCQSGFQANHRGKKIGEHREPPHERGITDHRIPFSILHYQKHARLHKISVLIFGPKLSKTFPQIQGPLKKTALTQFRETVYDKAVPLSSLFYLNPCFSPFFSAINFLSSHINE